jgi:undecaprenyl-phosphate 4-deoxy-4-formamido-L-arabinose transferase
LEKDEILIVTREQNISLAAGEAATYLPELSIVIPVYRSESMLPELARRIEDVVSKIAQRYELILVNDNSPDGSWEVISQIAAEHPWVRAIDLMRNFGQHNALLCGIRAARYAVIVTMDDDLQHPPEEIPKLIAVLAKGHDVVYGTPERAGHSSVRNLASIMTKIALQNTMGVETARRVSAFRAFRTEVVRAFDNYQGSFVSIDVLLTWGTNRFTATPVRHEPRKAGSSGYTLPKLLTHAMNMVTGFTTLPLQLASLIGFIFTVFGILVLGYVLLQYFLRGNPVPGFPFLASIIAVFSGAQLFALGIIGEYLARMHFRSMQKPPYVVRPHPAEKEAEGVATRMSH